jgi:hypothetical protein
MSFIAKGRPMNLNELQIPTDGLGGEPLSDFGVSTPLVDVHFRKLDAALIHLIGEAEVVVDCVAWLTHRGILDALAKTRGVSLVVQKEDFLRPDSDSNGSFARDLRCRYEALPTNDRLSFPFLRNMSSCGDPTIDAVRCVGFHNGSRAPASPRAHHKFAVFCREIEDCSDPDGDYRMVKPYAVWTGSFNFTQNACASFENAVVFRDPAIVRAYFSEFEQVCALSERCDWTEAWAEPEWRIGT